MGYKCNNIARWLQSKYFGVMRCGAYVSPVTFIHGLEGSVRFDETNIGAPFIKERATLVVRRNNGGCEKTCGTDFT